MHDYLDDLETNKIEKLNKLREFLGMLIPGIEESWIAGGSLLRTPRDIDVFMYYPSWDYNNIHNFFSANYPTLGFTKVYSKGDNQYEENEMFVITGLLPNDMEVDMMFLKHPVKKWIDKFTLSIQKVWIDNDGEYGRHEKAFDIFEKYNIIGVDKKFGTWEKTVEKYKKYYPEAKFLYEE